MLTVTSQDLRYRTAEVLRHVTDGTSVTVTVDGVPVADVTAHLSKKRASLSRREMLAIVQLRQADPGLLDDLRHLTGNDVDDLGPWT